jgi:hypothetical protein
MTNKLGRFLWTLTLVAAGAGWSEARSELRACRLGELASIAALLKKDEELFRPSRTGPETGAGILAAYLAKIRADGVAKQADTKQKLDRLAENNSAILALINVYLPHAETAAFSAGSDKFRRYAIAWRDRWNSVMELFMAGGNYPASSSPFPKEFAAAVYAEIAEAR